MKDNQLRWYVLQTYYGKEQRVYDDLSQKGYFAFLPYIRVDRRDNRQAVKECMFPGHLFVRLLSKQDDFGGCRKTRYAKDFIRLTLGEYDCLEPTHIPDKEINRFIIAHNHQGFIMPLKYDYAVNDTVRITGGPFKEYIARISKLKGDERVCILLNLMNTEREIEVDYSLIEAVN
jgi:transcription antitermination factor NusG